MSDGGVEVETSNYQVLPKDVVSEIGSIKLFNRCMLNRPALHEARSTNYSVAQHNTTNTQEDMEGQWADTLQ